MLKFTIKGQHLDFGSGLVTSETLLGIEGDGGEQVDICDEAMKVSNEGTWDRFLKLLDAEDAEEEDVV